MKAKEKPKLLPRKQQEMLNTIYKCGCPLIVNDAASKRVCSALVKLKLLRPMVTFDRKMVKMKTAYELCAAGRDLAEH